MLPFVSFTELEGKTVVKIDTTNADFGEYTLVLESFDTFSKAKSTLRTDLIRVIVIE